MRRFILPLLVIFIYVVAASVAFQTFPLTFFQQDEWLIYGSYTFWEKVGLSWWDRLVYRQLSHIIPLTNIFSFLQFQLFSLNFSSYAIVSVLIHIVNAVLVYLLSLKLLGNKYVSFIAGLLFVTNPIVHQAITWIATNTGTAGSTTFILVSLLFFVDYLKKQDRWRLLLCSIFLLTSLFFKETSIFSFIFFPVLAFIFAFRTGRFKLKKTILFFIIFGGFYFLARVAFLFYSYQTNPVASELTQPSPFVFVYRLITAPPKFIAQSMIPVNIIIENARDLIKLGYPQYELFIREGEINPFITETIAADIISYTYALGILLLTFLFFKLFAKSKPLFAKGLLISLAFIILSTLPYIFIPGKAGYFSLLDGRHLYLTSIFSTILVSLLLWGLVDVTGFKKKFVLTILVLLIATFNLTSIRNDMERLLQMGTVRKNILAQIYSQYPTLPSRAIIYAESDSEYYASGEKILPFQSGLGQTLLMWYEAHGQDFPACFFDGNYLFDWVSQGYRECEGVGYGYFREREDLQGAVLESHLQPENIIAFSFVSSTNELLDITGTIREKLQYQKKK